MEKINVSDPVQVKYAVKAIDLLRDCCFECGIDPAKIEGLLQAMCLMSMDDAFLEECRALYEDEADEDVVRVVNAHANAGKRQKLHLVKAEI